MKYLKLYEKFNNSGVEEIKTIKEILLELNDIGYYTSVNYTPLTMTGRHENDEIYVDISYPKAGYSNKKFTNDIEDYVSRIEDYMKFRRWNLINVINDPRVITYQALFKKNDNMNESKINTLEDKLAILKELSLPLMDAGLYVNITSTKPERFHGEGIYVEIMDNDKIFCRNYPEVDELDWLCNKPIMMEYYDELDHFGLKRERDYILYGGGLSATLFFTNKQTKAIKL